jgi:hypothetical protein
MTFPRVGSNSPRWTADGTPTLSLPLYLREPSKSQRGEQEKEISKTNHWTCEYLVVVETITSYHGEIHDCNGSPDDDSDVAEVY